ncbi:hypothetical protein Tco_0267364 [Tanacetum coccineum]
MAALNFVNSYNMVAYLERPNDSDDFTEIVDFLNANPIRRDLQFADEDGTDCLPTTTIFENLKLMGFLQVFLDKQLDKVPSHNAVYNAHCHTKKVFANMKRIGKDFLGKVTPLFDTMLIQHQSEVGDSLERAATTTSSLEAEQFSVNITKTRSKVTLNEPTTQGTSSGSGPRRQDTMGNTIAQTRFENVSKTSYDSPLGGVKTPRSDEDSMQLKELMEMCTNLLQRVQDLKTRKTAQAKEITSLKKRVKKLEQRGRLRTPGLKRLYKVGTSRRVESSTEASLGDQKDASKQGRNIAKIDADVDISLDRIWQIKKLMLLYKNVPITVSTATPTTPLTTTTEDDMTLAETLMEIKSAKPKAIGVVMQEPSKAKMVEEEEPKKPTKIKVQIKHDEELVQTMMEADYQMAERLQVEEQASLTDEEKARLFVQLFDARMKHFAALRA